jgi:hypothetical protein
MAIEVIIGMEVGDLSEFNATAGTIAIETTTINTGAYSVRVNPTTTGIGSVRADPGTQAKWSAVRFYFRAATLPSADSEEIFASSNLRLRVHSDGTIQFFNTTTALGTAGGSISTGIWYLIDIVAGFDTSGSNDEAEAFIDGVSATSFSGVDVIPGNLLNFFFGKAADRNGETVDFFYDDIRIDTEAADPGPIGAGQIIARSPITGGTPTYDAWTKSSGSDAGALWNDTPAVITDNCESAGGTTAQTADIADFSATQSGHGSETIASGDTINGVVAKVFADRGGGAGGLTMIVRLRLNGVDDDLDIGVLVTADRIYQGNIISSTPANIDIAQAGGVRQGGGGQEATIFDEWVMVDYTPFAGPFDQPYQPWMQRAPILAQ